MDRQLEHQPRALERADAGLRAANEPPGRPDLLVDDFIAALVHELRAPLASIRALAELMRDDPQMDAARRDGFLGIVVSETERLSRLVDRLLDSARIEAGHADWPAVELDLVPLLRGCAQRSAGLLRRLGTELALELPEAGVVVRADADALTQVLLNLISNAAKFAPVPDGRIVLALAPAAGYARVEVRDNGPGVPAGQQALIFEKYRQGGDRLSRPPGTGLGLPISRQIVEHFGGRLWLEPQAQGPGQGACFAFTLPLARHNNDGDRA